MRHGGERGAISLIVLGLLVTFVGLAAFAVDIALGYAEKRQQSIAADAASLAAARAVNEALPPGTSCDAATLQGASLDAAASGINSANDLDGRSSLSEGVNVDCSPAGANGIEVTVRNSEPVPTTFLSSQLLGIGGLEPKGGAASLLFVPDTGPITGLRPIAACEELLTNAIANGNEQFLVEISKDTGVCATAGSGNWGFVNFLDQGDYGSLADSTSDAYFPDACAGGSPASGGNAPCQNAWVRDGYAGPFYFPNTLTSPGPGQRGNSGNPSSNDALLRDLSGQEILLPVATELTGTGSNARLNVTGVMAAYVCAAKTGKTSVDISGATDPRCTYATPVGSGLPTVPNPAPLVDFETRWDDLKNNEQLLWVVPSEFLVSGAPLDPTTGCAIGDPSCDFGVRATQLWR